MVNPVDPTIPLTPMMSIQDLRRQLSNLQRRLESFVDLNPEHRVDGVALGLIDTLAASAAMYFEHHPIIDQLASGQIDIDPQRNPARAADLLIAVDLLLHSLPTDTE